jgi:hypothetical protein
VTGTVTNTARWRLTVRVWMHLGHEGSQGLGTATAIAVGVTGWPQE